ncbi:MAG: hypothetical protein JRD89_17565 [Deltaproteobacteria bacterium]|nr:hypothetical protein [Deltaproteobacteria bacterium]
MNPIVQELLMKVEDIVRRDYILRTEHVVELAAATGNMSRKEAARMDFLKWSSIDTAHKIVEFMEDEADEIQLGLYLELLMTLDNPDATISYLNGWRETANVSSWLDEKYQTAIDELNATKELKLHDD